jgi:hypothetical protein
MVILDIPALLKPAHDREVVSEEDIGCAIVTEGIYIS